MECLSEVIWVERTNFIDKLLGQELAISNIPAGLEANVLKFCSSTDSVVLKIWNKDSSPDVNFQHFLLPALRHRGISVSSSYGWGYTASKHKVLLTSYDGSPLSKITNQNVKDFADLLLGLHKLSFQELDPTLHKKYDFIGYFYPRIEEHQDIQAELIQLVKSSNLKQSKLIHGDFNLGNILDNQGKYTIIDWTNAQLGDARYDLAWSSFLINLYNGEELASIFRNAYIPRNEKTIERVNDIIIENKYLNRTLVLV